MKHDILFPLIILFSLVCSILIVTACGKPQVSDLIGHGLNCRANISMPENWQREDIEVKVKIFDCTEAK